MRKIMLKFDLLSGEAHVEVDGIKGQGCKDATKFLEKALGESKDFQRKAAWYETNLETVGSVVSNRCG